MVVGVTSFFEVASLSEMEGRAPMMSPSRAVFVVILQVFLWQIGEQKVRFFPPQRFKRELIFQGDSPCSVAFRFLEKLKVFLRFFLYIFLDNTEIDI